MKKSRRAGSIYATSNSNTKSQLSLKIANSRYNKNENQSLGIQNGHRPSDQKYNRHFDDQILERKLEIRRAQRNHSSGRIMRKSLAQVTNYTNKEPQRKCRDAIYQKLDYQRTIQKIKQRNPINNIQVHSSYSKGTLVDQSCNTHSSKKNTMALINILNYNFSGEMMTKTTQLKQTCDYASNNYDAFRNIKQNVALRDSKQKKQSQLQRYRFRHIQRSVDAKVQQSLKFKSQQDQRQLMVAMNQYTPYRYENLKNQKIKNFQQRYNSILSSYQRKKRQLSQQFNSMQNTSSKPINSKGNFENKSKPVLLENRNGILSMKPIEQSTDKCLNKFDRSSNSYENNFLINIAKSPIKNLMKDVKQRNQNAQNKFSKIERIEKDINARLNNLQRQKSKGKIRVNDSHQQFRQLFKVLDQQIEHEERLRNIKHQIQNHEKSSEIESNLALKGIARQQLKLSSEEYDPFQSSAKENQEHQRQYSSIVEQYLSERTKCEQHWKTKMVNMWNQQIVKRLFEKLDYSKKTQLSLKQFVREFNCLTNRNLRMRDLYKISERLKPMTKGNFIKKLSKIEI